MSESRHMSLAQWHEEVAPYLRDIEAVSISITLRVGWLKSALGNLPLRPAWPTKAQDQLDQAEQALNEAALQLRRIKQLYEGKPVLKYEPINTGATK